MSARHEAPTTVRVTMAAAILVGTLVIAASMVDARAATAQDGVDAPLSAGEADERVAAIERFVQDTEQDLIDLRSDRLDPDIVLEGLGADPWAILDWVRTETHWVPYTGVLRGPLGVLMDRSGNGVDRALLLSDLVTRAGHENRLATTSLPVDVATDAARVAFERGLSRSPDGGVGSDAVADEYRGRAAATAAALSELLPPSADTDDARLEDAVAAMREHWWVQVLIDDAWVDLDPVFGAPSSTRPDATDVIDAAALPDASRHGVTIRVIIERDEGDDRAEEVALEHAFRMGSSVPFQTTELRFDSWLGPEAGTDDVDGFEAMARLAGFWRPALNVGGEIIRGEWFSADGTLSDPGEPALGAKLSEGTSALGGLGGGEDEEPEPSVLSGAWIEFEVERPGAAPKADRRELFDADAIDPGLADPALQRGLAFLGETSILTTAADVHPQAIERAYHENWIDARPAMIALVFIAAGSDDDRIGPSLDILRQQPLELLLMASARSRWNPDVSSTYLAQPNIWARHLMFGSAADDVLATAAIDIVVNDIAVLPGTADDGASVRLQQGVVDTLVEHVLPGEEPGLNAWERFERRGEEGADWVTLTGPQDMAQDALLSLPTSELARIAESLATGDRVVVVTEPRTFGGIPFADWWRVAPDGTTLGIGFRGYGSEATERGAIDPRVRTVDPRVRARFEGVQKNGACKKFATAITVVDWLVVDDTLEFRRPDLDDTCK